MRNAIKLTRAVSTLLLAGVLVLTIGAHTATADPVSGTIYDVDALRARQGGFSGVKYPRYLDQNGVDVGQMLCPFNGDTAGFAFVMDLNSKSVAAVQATVDASNHAIPGVYTYSFPNLAPGAHHLLYIEPYREEVYQPSSKTITVKLSKTGAVATANFNLTRQWRLGGTIASTNTPGVAHTVAPTGVSIDYLNGDVGWAAVSTNNGLNNGWGPGRYAVDVYHTLDSGKTWTAISHLPAPVINNFGPADVGSMVPPQYGLHFTDALHGVLLAQVDWNFFFWGNGLLVLTTSDGGKTWSVNGNSLSQLANSGAYQTNGALVTPAILWVNDYYNSFTNEAAWDPNNRNNGVMYGVAGSALYTRTTTNGGRTWQNGLSLTGGPDVGASVGDNQRLFVFDKDKASMTTGMLSDYSGGSLFYDGASAWQLLTDTSSKALSLPSSGGIAMRASNTSALLPLNNAAGGHFYRTDDSARHWTQQYFYNGRDSYTGSLDHSYGYLSDRADLQPDDTVWLSSWSQDGGGLGRSMDALRSRSWMGALCTLWNFSSTHTPQRDASPDIHTGRRVLLIDPAYYGTTYPTTAIQSFLFDEEAPASPARIIPVAPYVGYHYNAGPGLYICLVNVGGDWASDVTITEVYGTNKVKFGAPKLPWNIGAIPPGSTTNQAYSWTDPGEIFFPLVSAPAGVTSCVVTISGHYNGGKRFSLTETVNL